IEAQTDDLARQARAADGRRHALGVSLGDKPAPRRIARRQHHAERDRLTVQEPLGKTRLCFQRVAEGMPQIEQRPGAGGLALILGDYPGLGFHAFGYRVFLRLAMASENIETIRLAPLE